MATRAQRDQIAEFIRPYPVSVERATGNDVVYVESTLWLSAAILACVVVALSRGSALGVPVGAVVAVFAALVAGMLLWALPPVGHLASLRAETPGASVFRHDAIGDRKRAATVFANKRLGLSLWPRGRQGDAIALLGTIRPVTVLAPATEQNTAGRAALLGMFAADAIHAFSGAADGSAGPNHPTGGHRKCLRARSADVNDTTLIGHSHAFILPLGGALCRM